MTPTIRMLRARRLVEDWRDLHDPDGVLNVTRTTALVAEALARSHVDEVSADEVHRICSASLERARQLEADRLAYLGRQAHWVRTTEAARTGPRDVAPADEHRLPSAPSNRQLLQAIGAVPSPAPASPEGRRERARRNARQMRHASTSHPHDRGD